MEGSLVIAAGWGNVGTAGVGESRVGFSRRLKLALRTTQLRCSAGWLAGGSMAWQHGNGEEYERWGGRRAGPFEFVSERWGVAASWARRVEGARMADSRVPRYCVK
jgi:hypothetical protein